MSEVGTMPDIIECLSATNVDFASRHDLYAVHQTAKTEISRLRAAFKIYGSHLASCPAKETDAPCICGLDKQLEDDPS
jgi:hypothetical protein